MASNKRKQWLIGNWKMNQKLKDIGQFFDYIDIDFMLDRPAQVLFGVAPQAIHASVVRDHVQREALSVKMKVGVQNISNFEKGAYTGEISAESVKDMALDFVIIGHSERRQLFQETSSVLKNKVLQALQHKLMVVFCVGETLQEREAKREREVVEKQLMEALSGLSCDQANGDNFIVAYEPVWAIGTGKNATAEQAEEMHHFIRSVLSDMQLKSQEISLLYGGSVNNQNFAQFMDQANIDGALVGGASLKGESYQDLAKILGNS